MDTKVEEMIDKGGESNNYMGIFNTRQTLEELEEKIDGCVPETQHLGAVFVNFRLQKKLLDGQNEYNKKQLFWSRVLAVATIGLVLATLLLLK